MIKHTVCCVVSCLFGAWCQKIELFYSLYRKWDFLPSFKSTKSHFTSRSKMTFIIYKLATSKTSGRVQLHRRTILEKILVTTILTMYSERLFCAE
mgnify:CR=1 FL=1